MNERERQARASQARAGGGRSCTTVYEYVVRVFLWVKRFLLMSLVLCVP